MTTNWYNYPIVGDFGQQFSWATYPVQGEDIETPYGTPITAAFSGTVINAYYDAGGGQVVVQADNPADARGIPYYWYAHLDQIQAGVGTHVTPGTQIGISGGQNSGGYHPAAPNYSSGPHLEFGLSRTSQIPYTQASITPDLNPDWVIASLQTGNIMTGVTTSNKNLLTTLPTPCQCPAGSSPIWDVNQWRCQKSDGSFVPCTNAAQANQNPLLNALPASFTQFFNSLTKIDEWLSDPIRILKLVMGIVLIAGAIFLIASPQGQLARNVKGFYSEAGLSRLKGAKK